MRFGYHVLNTNVYESAPLYEERGVTAVHDKERVYADFALIDIADQRGFDTVWASEHHFTSYMTTPSLTQYLAHVLGRTRNVDIGTGVIVLPWHDPVRVAEEVAMLDIMAGDRKLFVGFGRGASTLEFEGFRKPMGESRELFAEALAYVRKALTEEDVDFDGTYYQIPKLTTRPRPASPDLASRMYCAWFSPDSLERAAKAGLGALFSAARYLEDYGDEVAKFDKIREEAGYEPTPSKISSFVYCAESHDQAVEEGTQYFNQYRNILRDHYNWADRKYQDTPSYGFYAELGQRREQPPNLDEILRSTLIGTPDEIIDKIETLAKTSGCDEIFSPFLYGSMPYEKAEAQLHLFCDRVLPHVKALPVGGG